MKSGQKKETETNGRFTSRQGGHLFFHFFPPLQSGGRISPRPSVRLGFRATERERGAECQLGRGPPGCCCCKVAATSKHAKAVNGANKWFRGARCLTLQLCGERRRKRKRMTKDNREECILHAHVWMTACVCAPAMSTTRL